MLWYIEPRSRMPKHRSGSGAILGQSRTERVNPAELEQFLSSLTGDDEAAQLAAILMRDTDRELDGPSRHSGADGAG